jgi:hypothetical protein
LILNFGIGQGQVIGDLIPQVGVHQVVVLIQQYLNSLVSVCNRVPDEILEPLISRSLPNPIHWGEVLPLCSGLPRLANDLVPLLERVHVVSKLLVFGPLSDDLDRV